MRRSRAHYTVGVISDLEIATLGEAEVEFAWTAPTGWVGHQIRVSLPGVAQWGIWVDILNGIAALLLDQNTAYDFQVRAVDIDSKPGPSSNIFRYTTPAAIPDDIQDLTLSQVTSTSVLLSYTLSAGADGAEYRISAAGAGTWGAAAAVPGNGIVTGLTAAGAYDVQVRAENTTGASGWSTTETITLVGLTNLTLIISAVGNSATIPIPAEALAGDVCVLWEKAEDTAGIPASVVPTGFTTLTAAGTASGFGRQVISAKKLVAGDLGASPAGMVGTVENRYIVAIFRPNIAISAFAVNSPVGAGTGGDPAAQTTTSASAASLPILVYGQWSNRSVSGALTTGNTSSSPALIRITNGNHQIAGYTLYAAGQTPVNHQIDMPDVGNDNIIQVGYLTFTAA